MLVGGFCLLGFSPFLVFVLSQANRLLAVASYLLANMRVLSMFSSNSKKLITFPKVSNYSFNISATVSFSQDA